MKKILIIDNFDSFTFNLAEYFQKLDCHVEVYRNTIDPEMIDRIRPDAIVFSPGPSIPKNAGNMMKIIDLYHQKHPLLGICLGHEAFIEYFGGSLQFVEPVHGEASPIHHDRKTIFKDIDQDFGAGRYHSLAAEKVPENFEISAYTGDIVMAIRHKKLPIEGVQFHPESVLTMKSDNGLRLLKNFLDLYVTSPQEKNSSLTIASFMEQSIAGKLSFEQQENFLRNKDSFSAEELYEAVVFLKKQSPEHIELSEDAIDVCGTGGSKLARINTSTLSSFILAARGVKIAKHGNRAASGRFGSFDLLEKMGINFDLTTKDIEALFSFGNLAFLFARKFHPILKQFARLREKVGVPTFFNLLGPLLHPTPISRQIIGTAFRDKMEIIAETCHLLGRKHVYVVCGEDGLDEVTLTGITHVVELHRGKIKKYTISPKDFGISEAPFSSIQSKNSDENLSLAIQILSGRCKTRHLDLVLVNAALGLKLAGKVASLKEGYRRAREIIKNGMASEMYEKMKLLSQTSSTLLQIIAHKKSEIDERKKKNYSKKETANGRLQARDFKAALLQKKIALIAEIKEKSPAGSYKHGRKLSVIDRAKLYETSGAHAISIVCDKKFFGGDIKNVKKIKRATKKIPLLCKDFIIDAYQIYEAKKYGADAILLMASILTKRQLKNFLEITKKIHMDALCEVHSLEELNKVLRASAHIIGINSRNLHTLQTDTSLFETIIDHIPKNKIIVAESGIASLEDVKKLPSRINGMLVGTALMQAKNPERKLQELLNKGKVLLKICGVRSVQDAKLCEKFRVNFIGLNFVPTSKRHITLEQAVVIRRAIRYAKVVGIFQNQTSEEINNVARTLNLDYIQLSGNEDSSLIKKIIKPVIKTISVKNFDDIKKAKEFSGNTAFILFDSLQPGSGKRFDHRLLKNYPRDFFLAGGISPSNITDVVREYRPLAIDVATGAETAGRIDSRKVKLLSNSIKQC